MITQSSASAHPVDPHTSMIPPYVVPDRHPRLNALKHGLRSAAILLPDDDAQEFQCLRRDLFQSYRPQTREEAACVEAMAGHHWRMARCRRWQAVYDAQTDALLTGGPNGVAGHVCEPDPHRWMHKSMDCTLQEGRLDRLLCRTRDKLLLLQKLRRQNQIAGALEPPSSPWAFESPPEEANRTQQGMTVGGNEAASPREAGRADANGARSVPASHSPDGEKEKDDERSATRASPAVILSPALPRGRQSNRLDLPAASLLHGDCRCGEGNGSPIEANRPPDEGFPISTPAVGRGDGGGRLL